MGAQLLGFAVNSILTTALWALSVLLHDVSIIDGYWGFGFVINVWIFFFHSDTQHGDPFRKILIAILATAWGLRLTVYLTWRNWGQGEDPRYQRIRARIGDKFWWLSWVVVFMLQNVLINIISRPLFVAQAYNENSFGVFDFSGLIVWTVGMFFETMGDLQLTLFKKNPNNKGKVLCSGVWRYTRHPNYFGDACLWWGMFLVGVGASSLLESWHSIYAPALMTFLLLKVSGVALLERDIVHRKPQYKDYIEKTPAFLPWFPK